MNVTYIGLFGALRKGNNRFAGPFQKNWFQQCHELGSRVDVGPLAPPKFDRKDRMRASLRHTGKLRRESFIQVDIDHRSDIQPNISLNPPAAQ